jgi:DMSO/TMAO reductase YedYZ molybdopterin-dependent catalytic subunit
MDLLGQITEPAWRPTPLAALALGETPTDLHFVRDHFPVPKLDPRAWTLELAGANGRLTVGLSDIRALPSRTTRAVLECAGHRVDARPRRRLGWTGGIRAVLVRGTPGPWRRANAGGYANNCVHRVRITVS